MNSFTAETEKQPVLLQEKKAHIFDLSTLTHNEKARDPILARLVKLFNAGKYDNALEEAKAILKKKPEKIGAYYYAGIIRCSRKEYDKAIVNLKKAVAFPGKEANVHFYLGLAYEGLQKNQEAISEYQAYIKKTSDHKGKQEAQENIDRLNKNMKSGSETALAAVENAQSLPAETGIMRKPDEKSPFSFQISKLLTFIIEDSLSTTGQQMIGALDEFLAGEYDTALQDLKEIYQEQPNSVLSDNALYNTGLIYVKMQKWEKAASVLGLAVSRYPDGDVATASPVLLGHVYAEKGDYDSAVIIHEQYLDKKPNSAFYAFVNTELGDIAHLKNDFKNALKYYLKAYGRQTDRRDKGELNYKIGECYMRQDSQRGLEYLKLAAEDSMTNPNTAMEACLKLGDYFYSVRNKEDALKYYRAASEKFPCSKNTTWALYQTGNIHKEDQSYEEAIRTYQRLMDGFPNDYWALQAKWKRDDAIWENEYQEVLK